MSVQAQATVQIDNVLFRVTEWKFAPGTETGWHTHELDYVVVPTTSGRLALQTREGEAPFELELGQSYTRPAGSEHNVINRGSDVISFIEVEAKSA